MTPRVAIDPRVLGLPVSPTLASRGRSGELVAAGRRVYRLGLGQSPFPVPDTVVAALRAAAPEKDYLPPAGLPELRAAVADHHRRRHGLALSAENVVVGPGSKELMFLLQLCFDGDILLPTPSWVSYVPQARLAGRNAVALSGGGRHGIELTPEALARACATGDRPRLLFLNSPSNPTGLAYEPDAIDALAEVCRQHGVVVLSDEIYGELRFDGRHTSFARAYPEGTIVASGLSKWCGAGGWRLGTVALPPTLQPLRRALEAVASETYSTTSAPIQRAAIAAFRPSAEIEGYLHDARRVLHFVMTWAHGELERAGLEVPLPAGAFYLFPGFGPLREALAARGVHDDVALCELLLTQTGVFALPGSAFGMPRESLWTRLALVDFDGARALTVARDGVLDASFLRTQVAPLWEAIGAIAAFAGELGAGK